VGFEQGMSRMQLWLQALEAVPTRIGS
jgi:hypothetical protein